MGSAELSATSEPPAGAGGSADTDLIVLDTHTLIWWAAGSSDLPAALRRQVQTALVQDALWASSISAWEIAMLVQRGRLVLSVPVREWVARVESIRGLRFLPIDNALGIRAVELPDLHGDPADRLIVATAERLGATLVTRDERLRAYAGIKTLWT